MPPRRPRILLVDDRPDHLFLLSSALGEVMSDAHLSEVQTVEAALRSLEGTTYDAVLCDYSLGETSGLHLLRDLRERHGAPAFILITNHGSEELARQAFMEGAADYVTKETAFRDPSDLARRVERALEQKRRAEDHRRTEALFEDLLENNPFVILVFDSEGRVIRWNRALAALEEHPEDLQRLQNHYRLFDDPQLRETGVLDLVLEAREGRWVEIPPFPWNPERAGLSGPLRTFRGVVFPIELPDEADAHLCAMIHDVTAEEEARRERDEYAAILAALLHASNAAIVFVDPQSRVRFINRFAEELFGIRSSEYTGHPVQKLASEMARGISDPAGFLQKSAQLGEDLEAELDEHVETREPAQRHLRRHGGPVRSPDGRILGRIEVYTDETEAVVEQHVLEEENRELDAFASRLAHDLKTPLISLKGFADLLQRQYRENLDERGHAYLDRIRSSASMLNEMVDGLRDLARSGSEIGCTSTVDPVSLLRLVGEALTDLTREYAVKIVLPDASPPVACDRARFYQIFQNLLTNAVKYADHTKDPRWVEVRVEPGQGAVVFRVADNGVGMAAEEMKGLFQPFRRGSNTTDQSGMGLGLAITRRLVRASGGAIEARSVPGEGTTFTVSFPAAEEDGHGA